MPPLLGKRIEHGYLSHPSKVYHHSDFSFISRIYERNFPSRMNATGLVSFPPAELVPPVRSVFILSLWMCWGRESGVYPPSRDPMRYEREFPNRTRSSTLRVFP